jgi:hypothetical protein
VVAHELGPAPSTEENRTMNRLINASALSATVKMVNDKEGVNFDGVPSGGYRRFAQFLGSTRGSIEE